MLTVPGMFWSLETMQIVPGEPCIVWVLGGSSTLGGIRKGWSGKC